MVINQPTEGLDETQGRKMRKLASYFLTHGLGTTKLFSLPLNRVYAISLVGLRTQTQAKWQW